MNTLPVPMLADPRYVGVDGAKSTLGEARESTEETIGDALLADGLSRRAFTFAGEAGSTPAQPKTESRNSGAGGGCGTRRQYFAPPARRSPGLIPPAGWQAVSHIETSGRRNNL